MEQLAAMPDDWTRALAVAAHPDDLEYGAAGAIAAWTAAGKEVVYALVTSGEAGIDGLPPQECGPVREAEQRAAAEIVGVTAVEFLGYRDGVVEYGLPLRRDLARVIRRHRPELIVVPNHHDTWPGGGWNTPDHRNTGRALLDAVGDAGNRWIFPDLDEPPWSGVRHVAVSGSPHATHAVDVTSTLDTAVASLEAHRAYLAALGEHPMADARGFLEYFARLDAPRFGGRPAATFELISL